MLILQHLELPDTEDAAFRSLPLVTGSGLVDRVLELRVDPRELQLLQEAPLLMEWHEEVLGTIAEVLSLTLQNLQLHEQLEKQALMDPLTGIFQQASSHFSIRKRSSPIAS